MSLTETVNPLSAFHRYGSKSAWISASIFRTFQQNLGGHFCSETSPTVWAACDKALTLSVQPMSPPAEQEQYTCSICGKKFPNKAQLKNHVLVFHPNSRDAQAEREAVQAMGEHLQPDLPEDLGEMEDEIDESTIRTLKQAGNLSFRPLGSDIDEDDAEEAEEATAKLLVPAHENRLQSSGPLYLTEERLKALGPAMDPAFSLARSMGELSVDDRSMGDRSYLRDEDSPSEMSDVGTTYSIEDVDDEPFSDVADSESPTIQLGVSMLLFLFNKLVIDFAKKYEQAVRTMPANAGDTPSHRGPASVSQESFHTSASFASSVRSGVTRPREDDDDDEEENERPQQRRKKSKTVAEDNKLLACPFNKFNNMTFGTNSSTKEYHVCSTWSDVKTAYLKQHLLRTHCMPEFSCDRCGVDCRNNADLRKHLRAPQPCEVKELDSQKIMPEIQEQLGLRTRNKTKTDKVGYWYQCFDLIFGREARDSKSIDPFYNGPLHEDLTNFVAFSRYRMPALIESVRGRLNLQGTVDERELGEQILEEAKEAYKRQIESATPANLRESQQRSIASFPSSRQSEASAQRAQSSRAERTIPMQSTPQQWSPNQYPEIPTPYQQLGGTPMQLPTRLAHHEQILPSPQEYQQQQQFYYSAPSEEDFQSAPYLGNEFQASLETTDLYGPGELPEDFGFQLIGHQNQPHAHDPNPHQGSG